MKEKIITSVAVLLGVSLIANGIYQLVAPESWYWMVPGVPDRGPFNQHFVRDIGIVYALCGVSLVLGGLNPDQRFAYWLGPAAWLAGHEIFHIWEVIVGICGPATLLEDFAGVALPAIIVVTLLVVTRGDRRPA